jgi:NAD(P)-dependent dehydrogenase (short-subunit alcohol dehydrogenase family)
VAVVTGGTGGLGLETAMALAGAGAQVILAGRNTEKGRAAVAAIAGRHPGAHIRFSLLDLASLASVAAFAAALASEQSALDLLVNNAGVMSLPKRRVTTDGFEMQFGTNYLGHFALTARLLPLLRASNAARVVQVSSIAHRAGRIDFADLQCERHYRPWPVYAQSKLAMLLFALALQRHSDAARWGLLSNAAHPGWSRTDLFANGPRMDGNADILTRLSALAAPLLSQSAARGALPILFAATSPAATGGGYYGPNGVFEMKGEVSPARIMPQGRDMIVAERLWDQSEALTGVRFGDHG